MGQMDDAEKVAAGPPRYHDAIDRRLSNECVASARSVRGRRDKERHAWPWSSVQEFSRLGDSPANSVASGRCQGGVQSEDDADA